MVVARRNDKDPSNSLPLSTDGRPRRQMLWGGLVLGCLFLVRGFWDGSHPASSDPRFAVDDPHPLIRINLNECSATELSLLPTVGDSLAQRIVQWRIANGPFTTIDQLREVSGIGPATLAEIRRYVEL